MKKTIIAVAAALACTTTVSSKDKATKVPFSQMAVGMRDAFNCGVIVEQHLHGVLKDNPDEYRKEQIQYNCDHVQDVLSTLHDQDSQPPGKQ